VHFTPTSGSWLNLVEVWFSIIERQAIHRGTFGSVKELNAKIRAFINGWNDRCHPFVWTKTAEEILKKANRYPISETAHEVGDLRRARRAQPCGSPPVLGAARSGSRKVCRSS
jgi:hypothetical protein